MGEIQIFTNPEFGQVRTVEHDGSAWFVGKDVARALGYEKPTDAVRKRVDAEDRGVSKMETPSGRQEMTIVNESGLYSLVLGSKLPTAKKFKRWVTSEVLPSIRKHGAYMTADTIEQVIADPDAAIRLLTTLKEEREARRELESQKIALEAEKAANRPKVLFAESVSASEDTILISELAKLLRQNGVDIGQRRLFQWLRENGYLVRRPGSEYNLPTQRSMELGLFTIKETSITHADGRISLSKTPKVTGKGQVYFTEKFLA